MFAMVTDSIGSESERMYGRAQEAYDTPYENQSISQQSMGLKS